MLTRVKVLARVACVLLLLVVTPVARAHKFYTSLAQVEYNERDKTAEVALRVFADDLEAALKKRAGRVVRLDGSPESAALAFAYLRETFEIRNRDGEAKALKWVGMELQSDVAWLYFEAPLPEGLSGASLRDRVLFDFSAEQVNIVHVKHGGKQTDLVFKAGDANFKTCP